MGIYDINGRELDSGSSSTPYLSSSLSSKIKPETSFDVSGFSLIHEFTPFETDYSASSSNAKYLDFSQNAFYTTFYDKYLGVHGNLVVTKKNLGKDQSGLYDIWCYDFKPYKSIIF